MYKINYRQNYFYLGSIDYGIFVKLFYRKDNQMKIKKINNLAAVALLSINIVLQPISTVHTVLAEESGSEVSITEEIVESTESLLDKDQTTLPVEEPDSTEDSSLEEMPPNNEGTNDVDSEQSSESKLDDSFEEISEESLEEKNPFTQIVNNINETSNYRTGSQVSYSFNLSNSEAVLTEALIRVTVPTQYVETELGLASYFPNQGLDGQLSSKVEGNNLIVEYNAGELSASYNKNFNFVFKTIDNGLMKDKTTIPVKAEVIKSNNVIAQTSVLEYQFVTKQPQFVSNVTYPSEDSDEDGEPTLLINYTIQMGDEGTGNGSGRSELQSVTLYTSIPEGLTLNLDQNSGWNFDEINRIASFTYGESYLNDSTSFTLPTTLVLSGDTLDLVNELVLNSSVTFISANGDVIETIDQSVVSNEALSLLALSEIAPLLITENYTESVVVTVDGEEIPSGETITFDPNRTNVPASIQYNLQFPNDADLAAGETYELTLPEGLVFGDKLTPTPILVDGIEVANYIVQNGQVVISFTENANNLDDKTMFFNVNGIIDVDVFETREEIEIQIPYSDGSSYSATIKPDGGDIEGTDSKQGYTYSLEGNNKTETTYQPTHADWVVRVNDTMSEHGAALISDIFDPSQTLVPESVKVYRIIRNYKGEDIGREEVVDFNLSQIENGFEIDLGAIDDTYEIEYTTEIDPSASGTTTVRNNASIIKDGETETYPKDIEVEWGTEYPGISKQGFLKEGTSDVIVWEVKYNFNQASLGDVTFVDELSKGQIDLSTLEVLEVGEIDRDGNPLGLTAIDVTPTQTGNEPSKTTFSVPNSDGKAFVIRYESKVPAGHNGSVTNTFDDLDIDETDPVGDEVIVNTEPDGSKIGEQLVDENGQPYILWTITLNEKQVDVGSINGQDTFNTDLLVLDEDSFTITPDADLNRTTNSGGFSFTIPDAGSTTYVLTYKTTYTEAGLNAAETANNADLEFFVDGEGIGEYEIPDYNIDAPKPGITKSGKYVANDTLDEQTIQWEINFNQSKIVLKDASITDIFNPADLSIIENTFGIYIGDQLVPNSAYAFAETADGFTVQFLEDTQPATYTIRYQTNAINDTNGSASNTATLNWQGLPQTADATVESRAPGVSKSGQTVVAEDGSKTNEWTIKFNTNKQVIYDFVLTDTYTPSTAEVVGDIVLKQGDTVLTSETDYTISGPTDGSFTVTIAQLKAAEYTLEYATSYSPEDERLDVNNEVAIQYRGGEDGTSANITKPTLKIEKSAEGVDKTTDPVQLSWKVNANDNGVLSVNLVDAVWSDFIPTDQSYVPGTFTAVKKSIDGAVIETIKVGDPDSFENGVLTLALLNGTFAYEMTFKTQIESYPSNDLDKQDRYRNTTTLTNQTQNMDLTDTADANAFQDYFAEGENNNPNKLGEQNHETENIDWSAIVNPNGLPVNNAKIVDTISNNQTYIANSIKVFTVVDGAQGVELTADSYAVSTNESNFEITFTSGDIDQPYMVTYQTRLKPELVGFIEVSNTISLHGTETGNVIEETSTTTLSEQWTYGGGGVGRTLSFNLMKRDTEQEINLSGVEFKLERVTGQGDNLTFIDVESFVTPNGIYVKDGIRAGRYVLTETQPRPGYVGIDPIYFTLGYSPDGSVVATVTDNSWYEGNNSNVTIGEDGTFVVNNSKEKSSVSATKNWELLEALDNYPDVWFKLYRQIEDREIEEVTSAELKQVSSSQAENNTVTWDNLDVYDNDGKEYAYSVKEVDAEGNDFTPTGFIKNEDGLVVTNTQIDSISVTGSKTWVDGDNQDGVRPTSITVNLLADEVEIDEQVVSEDTNWAYNFENLPIEANGTEITYTVTEDEVEGYTTKIDGYDITNSREVALTNVTVTKVWDDNDNQDGIRPNQVFVQLNADGEATGDLVSLNDVNNWTTTWNDLPVNEVGTAIEYTVTEISEIAGYEVKINQEELNNVVITNTHTPEVVEVVGTKTWLDNDNQDGVRPDSITVNLLANGVEIDEQVVTFASNWTYAFTNLPKYEDGTRIIYTITEDSIPEYSTEVDGYDIINTHTPDETSITVTKAWNDNNNQDGIRPNSVFAQLYADGEVVGEALSLNVANNWTETWTGLPVNSDGEAIAYTIAETSEPLGYEVIISQQDLGNVTITNTHIPEVVEVAGNKTWLDNDNQDGVRPESLSINLLADGLKIAEQVVTADSDWTYTFTDLPKFVNGNEVVYTITENYIPEYSTEIDGNDIINTHTPEERSITATKAWIDNFDQDGLRPNSILVQLFANGEAVGETVSLSAANNWTTTWIGLPVNQAGQSITYSVSEVSDVEGYQVTISQIDPGFVTIANIHTPEVIEIAGTKTWLDNENQDGVRPEAITVNLLADGVKIDERLVSAESDWTYAFTNLPKFINATEVVYTVTENSVAEYSTEINSYDIINTHTPGETSVTVTKAWDDNNNQDGIRPNEIFVQLNADGEAFGEAVSLNAANNWTTTWTALPVNSDGEAITYSVSEVSETEGYAVTISQVDLGNVTITNTHLPEVTEVAGTKTWLDNNNQDGIRPESITVNLLADGQEIAEQLVTAESDWTYSFTNLPKFTDGTEVVYTVTENSVAEYSTQVDGFDIINTYTPGETSVTVTKSWNDTNNQDGLRPTEISVQLNADGEALGEAVSLNASNNWTFTWNALPINADGQAIKYTLSEVSEIAGYDVSVDQADLGNVIITNTHTPEVTEVTGTKTWVDNNNQDGVRPNSITVNLLANGLEVNEQVVTAASDWTYTFTNLPKYENGTEVVYTVTENSVAEYSTEVDGFDIINTHTPGETSVTVTKAWVDQNNQDGIRPNEIFVQLSADGEAIGEAVSLNTTKNWTTTWTGLPINVESQAIAYTVSEVTEVSGYEVSVNQTNLGNVIITNTHVPEMTEVSGTKTWVDNDNEDNVRPDSIIVNLFADGEPFASQVVTAETNWTYVFENLPKYSDGTLVTYSITENSVEGYSTTIDGFNLTNSYKPTTPETPDKPSKPKLPETGEKSIVWIGLLVLTLGLALIIISKFNKKTIQ